MLTRYKSDNVLLAESLANTSRFAAVASRKLARDGKYDSGGCIEIHALLQVCWSLGPAALAAFLN